MASKSILVDRIRRTVGTGAETKVWEDVWIPGSPARAAKPKLPNFDVDLRVHHLIDHDRKEWKVDLISEVIDAEDVPRIISLRISKTNRSDGYSWNHTSSGCYSVKSGYAIAVEQRRNKQDAEMLLEPSCNSLKKKVWKLKAPRKMKHYLWQALSGYVASASKLKERHCGTYTVCQWCGAENETINHILFECSPAIQCWALSTVPSSPGFFPCSSIYVNFDTLLRLGGSLNTEGMDTPIFPWIIWYLWKARNDKCFSNKDTSPMDTLQLARHEAEAWKLAQIVPEMVGTDETHEETQQAHGTSAANGRWRCQVDASWTEQDTGTGLGFTLLEENTEIVVGQRKVRLSNSPLHAEAECLVWAMEELSGRGFKHVNFESDCQQLVQIVTSPKAWPALAPELNDIQLLRSSFSLFSLCFISRSLNLRADSLAKEARSRDSPFILVDVKVPQQLALEARVLGPI